MESDQDDEAAAMLANSAPLAFFNSQTSTPSPSIFDIENGSQPLLPCSQISLSHPLSSPNSPNSFSAMVNPSPLTRSQDESHKSGNYMPSRDRMQEVTFSQASSFGYACNFSQELPTDNLSSQQSPVKMMLVDEDQAFSEPCEILTPELGLDTDWDSGPDYMSMMTETNRNCDSPNMDSSTTLSHSLSASISAVGLEATATEILQNQELSNTILKLLLESINIKFKKNRRTSILNSKQRVGRDYLFSLTPHALLEEMRETTPEILQLIATGLLGIVDLDSIEEEQDKLNILAMIYGTASKSVNQKATGYCLRLTTIARDGGLREDSLKLLSFLCSPRTAQRYDKNVLGGADWNSKLLNALQSERKQFEELREAKLELEQKTATLDFLPSELETALAEIKTKEDNLPPQLQIVWDNVNLKTNHRFERKDDNYKDFNYDWMASLIIQDRISANHMEHESGNSLKDPSALTIEDFIPNEYEKNYIFDGLVHYFSSRLVTRHTEVFKSINPFVKVSTYRQLILTKIN